MRADYRSDVLMEDTVEKDPYVQFEKWIKRAKDSDFFEPHGMTLCTATKDGIPASRVVLLRHFDHRGFVFYTNYHSRKGKEMEENPNVAASFWWHESCVRIEGTVEKVTPEESDAYYAARPRASQLGAWASDQSQVIPNRNFLEERVIKMAQDHPDPVKRPEHWGGFRIKPRTIEFWQGRPSRLHDRLRFTRTSDPENPWHIERLAP